MNISTPQQKCLPPFLSFFFLLLFVFAGTQTQAQTFNIDGFFINGKTQHCSDSDFQYGGFLTKPLADSAEVTIFFGDGTTDTIIVEPFDSSGFFGMHTYSYSGIYSIMIAAKGENGEMDTLLLPNRVIKSDTCGNISGKIYKDANSNCAYDIGETPVDFQSIGLLYNGNLIAVTYSDANGNYSFSAATSLTYEVVKYTGFGSSTYDVVCPVSGKYTVSTFPSSANDFAFSCKGGFDLGGSISAWRIRPQFQGYVYFNVFNNRCLTTGGTAKLVLNPLMHYQSATPTPASVSGDTLIWNFGGINNDSNYLFYTIEVITDSTATLGDTLCISYFIDPVTGDSVPGNNNGEGCIQVRNSWDPNMKVGSPYGSGTTGNIAANTDITYTVHFQNTGTDIAYNIFIIDTIDNNIDLNSFEYLGTSHQPVVTTMLSPGIMKYRFDNIMLPDSNADEPGSHGFIQYRVKQKPNLTPGTEIKQNAAGIYFDFNPPVITNNVLHTITLFTAVKPVKGSNGLIYPNPVAGELSILLPDAGDYRMSVYNISGQEVLSTGGQMSPGETLKLDVASLTPGMYVLTVQIGNEVVIKKFSKQ